MENNYDEIHNLQKNCKLEGGNELSLVYLVLKSSHMTCVLG